MVKLINIVQSIKSDSPDNMHVKTWIINLWRNAFHAIFQFLKCIISVLCTESVKSKVLS